MKKPRVVKAVRVWGLVDSRGVLWKDMSGEPVLFMRKYDTQSYQHLLNPKRHAVSLTITATPPRAKGKKKRSKR